MLFSAGRRQKYLVNFIEVQGVRFVSRFLYACCHDLRLLINCFLEKYLLFMYVQCRPYSGLG